MLTEIEVHPETTIVAVATIGAIMTSFQFSTSRTVVSVLIPAKVLLGDAQLADDNLKTFVTTQFVDSIFMLKALPW